MNSILEQYQSATKITTWDKQVGKTLANLNRVGVIACDTETTGLLFHTPSYLWDESRWVDSPFPFGLTLTFRRKNGRVVLVWGRVGTRLYDECKRVLASPNIKVWHNMKYDRRVCKTNEIELGGPQQCTLTMSRIYWDRRKAHGLQPLSEFMCPEMSDWEVKLNEIKKRLKGHWTRTVKKEDIQLPVGVAPNEYFNYSFIPDDIMSGYSMIDGFMDLMIYEKLNPIMACHYRDLYVRERSIVDVIIKIEEVGMGFDAVKGRAAIKINEPKIAKQWKIIEKLAGPDITTHPPKLIHALLGLGVTDKQLTDKGKMTSGADVLRRCLNEGVPKFAERFIKALLSYRAYKTITSTYLKPLTEMAERTGGIVYTNINPTSTRTGRPASTDPNLLNIPKPTVKKQKESNPVRECFVPRDGNAIYYFDIAQQEYAVLLLYAEQYDMIKAYVNGADIHQTMADKLGRNRDSTKNCNFGVTYGLGVESMSKIYGLTVKQAKEDMAMYNKEFPFIADFQHKCKMDLKQQGYVEDFFGRRYHIPYGQAYKAVNALVQGGCAQAFKIGLLQVDSLIADHHAENIILPVYDEIQIEKRKVPQRQEKTFCKNIIDAMVDIPQLLERGLRLRVDVEKTVTNWAEKKKVKL